MDSGKWKKETNSPYTRIEHLQVKFKWAESVIFQIGSFLALLTWFYSTQNIVIIYQRLTSLWIGILFFFNLFPSKKRFLLVEKY